MYAELEYQDRYYKGTVILDVSKDLSELNDVIRLEDGIFLYENDDPIYVGSENTAGILDAIADRLYREWGNGFGWEEKVCA